MAAMSQFISSLKNYGLPWNSDPKKFPELVIAEKKITKDNRLKIWAGALYGVIIALLTLALSPDLATGFKWFANIYLALSLLYSIKIKRLGSFNYLLFLLLLNFTFIVDLLSGILIK